MSFYETKIGLEEIPRYKEFDKTKNKVRKIANEEKEFEEE